MNTNIKEQYLKALEKSGYGIVGRHSAVKPCLWTKKSITDEDICYKQLFYNIESHRCLQMSPAALLCTHRCIFCWRPISFISEINEIDDPEFILEESIKIHRKLLVGFKGNPKANLKKWEESRNPKHLAISLIGEPTLYPKLAELIEYAKKRNMTTFLVTNGTNPEALLNLDPLPTQLYVSITATNEEMYKKVCRPISHDSWKKILETLEILNTLNTRKVLRLTLIRKINMEDIQGYANLIQIAEPDFIEPKAFMLVGSARERLNISHMPSHQEILDFSIKLSQLTSYEILDEKKESRVVLLSNKRKNRYIT